MITSAIVEENVVLSNQISFYRHKTSRYIYIKLQGIESKSRSFVRTAMLALGDSPVSVHPMIGEVFDVPISELEPWYGSIKVTSSAD